MLSKIILGLIMGFCAGSGAKALMTAREYPGMAPSNSGWFSFSAGVAPIIAICWIFYTFGVYPAKFGFMAIAEVVVGAILAGLVSHEARLKVAVVSVPLMLIAWTIL